MSLSENLISIKKNIPDNVKLVAVSKTKPAHIILDAYNCGQKIFGENKVQELVSKYDELPKDIEWHLIGHLQTNKIKYIAHFVHLIHSVDSLKLLEAINKEALKNDRIINCLLQIHIASEETKFGLNEAELIALLESPTVQQLKNIKICGLMGMATFTDDISIVSQEFKGLYELFTEIQSKYFTNMPEFKEISMGMSDDYKIAIEQGSTMVRLGSVIFGERTYNK
jgi:pyridoxal phosphate enzyme (YggS family)